MGLFGIPRISTKELLKDVAHGRMPCILDLRGDYTVAIPGSIPLEFEPDVFYEQENWLQEKLDICFSSNQTVVVVCQLGPQSDEAVDYFTEKNPTSRFTFKSLKGGFYEYQVHVDKVVRTFKRREQFKRELTALATMPERFHYLMQRLTQEGG